MRLHCQLAAQLAPSPSPAAPRDPKRRCLRSDGPLTTEQLVSVTRGPEAFELAGVDASVVVLGQTEWRGDECVVSATERQTAVERGVKYMLSARYDLTATGGRVKGTAAVTLTCTASDGTTCSLCTLECTSAA